LGQRTRPQYEHRAHNRIFKGIADRGRMRTHQPMLQLVDFVPPDMDSGKSAKPGRNAVHDPITVDSLLDNGAGGSHTLPSYITKNHRHGALRNGDHLGSGEGTAIKNNLIHWPAPRDRLIVLRTSQARIDSFFHGKSYQGEPE
jgi:hypothetical protein